MPKLYHKRDSLIIIIIKVFRKRNILSVKTILFNAHTHTHTHTHTRTRARLHAHTHARMHTHARTHTQSHRESPAHTIIGAASFSPRTAVVKGEEEKKARLRATRLIDSGQTATPQKHGNAPCPVSASVAPSQVLTPPHNGAQSSPSRRIEHSLQKAATR